MSDATPSTDVPAPPPRRFLRLRIAVSVFFGVLTIAICVLWVRSLRQAVYLQESIWDVRAVTIYSFRGSATIDIIQADLAWMVQFGSDLAANRQVNRWVQPNRDAIFALDVRYFPTSLVIRTPHWFLAILCAALGALPWISYRFSLRTLLIATALVAVVLGIVGYAIR